MRELNVNEIKEVNGGGGEWNTNDSLSATVIRNAGFGAMGGALGGGFGALAGGFLGALWGLNVYYSSH